jgi:hypothetical protein
MADRNVPLDFLLACLEVGFGIGSLTWRTRPQEHFPSKRAWAIWNSRYAGTPALATLNANAYRWGDLTFGGIKYRLLAHRVIWAMAHGRWPTDQIDHINGARDDNRLENLREATQDENQHNRALHRLNTSGYPGVSWDKAKRKWQANIRVGGRQVNLGRFPDRQSAARAYLAAKAVLHPTAPTVRGKAEG